MKAVIDVSPPGSAFRTARRQLKAADSGSRYGADYHLSFESARALFFELTPSRIDLLEALRRCGPCSVYALAKRQAGRAWPGAAHSGGTVFVPFESLEIRLTQCGKHAGKRGGERCHGGLLPAGAGLGQCRRAWGARPCRAHGARRAQNSLAARKVMPVNTDHPPDAALSPLLTPKSATIAGEIE